MIGFDTHNINSIFTQSNNLSNSMTNLNPKILVYGMTSRCSNSIYTLWINYCDWIVVITIFCRKCLTNYGLRNIPGIKSFKSVIRNIAHALTSQKYLRIDICLLEYNQSPTLQGKPNKALYL